MSKRGAFKRSKPVRYKTARCILTFEDEFLLAVHSSFWARPNRRWGLPGGGIERRESPEEAARREIAEEFDLDIDGLHEVGAYHYKKNLHVVYGAPVNKRLTYYDDRELLEIGWFSLPDIERFADEGKLHAGYELAAINAYLEDHF